MSGAVLVWLVLCGSLAAPRLARGDACDSNPCKNGGICLSGLNDDFYSCECPEGFSDPNCSNVVEVEYCVLLDFYAEGGDSTV